MTIIKKNWVRGIRLKPDNVAFDGKEGELKVDLASSTFKAYLGGASRDVVTTDQSQTLTNKTIDFDSNTASNIDDGNIKAGAAIDASKIADGSVSNTEFQYLGSVTSDIQTQFTNAGTATAAVQTNLDAHISDSAGAHAASAISNTPSGNLAATTVQGALNELQTDVNSRALQTSLDTTNTNLSNHIDDSSGAHAASAISVTPSGNLAASDAQTAFAELQTDVDTRATTASLTAHTGASSGVHGVSGSVVGTTDTQTLSSKTLTSPVLNSPSIVTPSRSDVKQDTAANLTTYAATADNGQLCFATDSKVYYTVVDGALVALAAATPPKIAVLSDVKTANTNGGSSTSGSWVTRALNTMSDPESIVASLASNQFTLSTGTYLIEAFAVGLQTDRHKAKIRNITDSTDDLIGTSEYADPASGGHSATKSNIVGYLTISGSKTFELQHRVNNTVATTGFGVGSSFSVSEVYSIVKITRIS